MQEIGVQIGPILAIVTGVRSNSRYGFKLTLRSLTQDVSAADKAGKFSTAEGMSNTGAGELSMLQNLVVEIAAFENVCVPVMQPVVKIDIIPASSIIGRV